MSCPEVACALPPVENQYIFKLILPLLKIEQFWIGASVFEQFLAKKEILA